MPALDLKDVAYASLGLQRADHVRPKPTGLRSGNPALDAFLGGGVPVGAVTEWGVPLGFGGRHIVLPFLAAATQPEGPLLPALWVYPDSPLRLNPPAWHALGVDLRHVAFACTNQPMQDLKPALLDPYYRLVVFDMPLGLSRDDYAFLARQARLHGKIIFILHNHLLSEAKGNAFAKLRLNCTRAQNDPNSLIVTPVRGLAPQALKLALGSAL